MNKSKNKKRGVKREKGRQRRVFFFRAKSGEEGEAGWGDEKREGGVFFLSGRVFFSPQPLARSTLCRLVRRKRKKDIGIPTPQPFRTFPSNFSRLGRDAKITLAASVPGAASAACAVLK